MKTAIFVFIACLSVFSAQGITNNPIAVFHGIGDSCKGSGMKFLTERLGNGVHVYSRCIESHSSTSSWYTNMNDQCETACNIIKSDPNFANQNINVVGLSQGSLIARCIIQSCNFGGKVDRFLSIGGPHMGVQSMPQCADGSLCSVVNWAIRGGVYSSLAQSHVGPAGYFKDPSNYQKYLKKCTFLPNLNNERDVKNATYKERFGALEKVMLVMFEDDTIALPKETAWFGFYDENKKLLDMTETKLYQEDYIGLKKLDQESKIKRVSLPGDHLRYTTADIDETFVPFLWKPEIYYVY